MVPVTDTAIGSSEALKQKALRSLGNMPPFSAILNRLMASLAGENVSFAKLGDLIEKDTVVAGNLLHLVNSAMYSRRATINSVRHALALLGVEKIRNAVLGMSVTRMWNKLKMPPTWSMGRFNMHSAAVAILSDQLAQQIHVTYPEGAFVAGLLHDVGHLLTAVSLSDYQARIVERYKRTGERYVDCEQEILGFTHAELSSDALAFWNIPEPMRVAVLFHHDPERDDSAPNPGILPLSRIVDAANQYVNSKAISIVAAGTGAADATLIENLGLSEERLQLTLTDFKLECEVMAQFFR